MLYRMGLFCCLNSALTYSSRYNFVMPHKYRRIPELSEKAIRLFWKKVNVLGENDCWIWTACLCGGRGIFAVNGMPLFASRISYKMHTGADPGTMMVCHSCDNKACVNPKHLFLGTNADNMRDMVFKNRSRKLSGDIHPATKLSNAQALDAMKLRKIGLPYSSIAAKYGVSISCISRIANGYRKISR